MPAATVPDIRDIKPPVYFTTNYSFLIVIAAIIVLAIFGFFITRFLKEKLKKKASIPSVPPKPAHIIAYEALEALQVKYLIQHGKIKECFFELSGIIRRYIENRFSIRAPEMTTEEFLTSIRDSGILTGLHKNLVKRFLELCDIVKFAKYGPTPKEIDKSFEAAKKLIDETKSFEEEFKKITVK